VGTRSRAGVHGGLCSPYQVHEGGPRHLGGQQFPQPLQVCLVGLAPRAAYARTPRLSTSPNGFILGITAVTVMSSPARRDSSRAYLAMNRWVALDPAYPPLAGDPLIAAPLLTTTTTLLPGGSGCSSASRSQVNAVLTSACQLAESVSHVWYWSGRITGLAHAARMIQQARRHRRGGRIRDLGLDVRAGGGQLGTCRPGRATATTRAPASASARAIPRPRLRLAPATTVVLPDRSLIIVLFPCVSVVSLAVVLVVAAPPQVTSTSLAFDTGGARPQTGPDGRQEIRVSSSTGIVRVVLFWYSPRPGAALAASAHTFSRSAPSSSLTATAKVSVPNSTLISGWAFRL